MIEENIKIHNKFSLELKLGYTARKKKAVSQFVVNTWIFIPNSLDINHYTYEKKDFYRDLKSNIRLITPVFLLRDIASGKQSPLLKLEEAIKSLTSEPTRSNIAKYEYHIKMFLSILKSALREESEHISKNTIKDDILFLVNSFIDNIRLISARYRNLRRAVNVSTISPELLNYYLFGDEFMSNIIEQHCFKIIKNFNGEKGTGKAYKKILAEIDREVQYKVMKGFLVPEKDSPDKNREFVHRLTLLKKYAENVLFATAHKKKDGILKEQVYYSIAAGLSMIFATAIAFSFQLKYGNFTMPFFVALVVSYMLKDRIKELGRHYFAHRAGKGYFDHKTKISLNEKTIGWSKEGMDFIDEAKVPVEILKMRSRSAVLEAYNRNNDEKIILYRKLVRLDRKSIDELSDYTLNGINEILRFNINSFTMQMDNPDIPLFIEDATTGYTIVTGEKIYFLNLLMQIKAEDQTDYKRYRIVFNREGIKEIQTL
jgi:hypothetical protein